MADEIPKYFGSHLELARLPYFEVRGGRLVLADRDTGPAIDMHAHLSMSFWIAGSVDLDRAPRPTEHYLPTVRPLHLEGYANLNLTASDRWAVTVDFARSVLDPTRRGQRSTHTVPNLLREMHEMNVARALLLPVDWPLFSENARRHLAAAEKHPELTSLGSVHPYALNPARELDRQKARGAVGIKMHPFLQVMSPDHPRAMRLYRLCGQRSMFVLWHCGPAGIEPGFAQRREQVRLYEHPIAETPETTFMLGHSGALQMEQALRLARTYPNVWLELSSQSLGNVRRILEQGPTDRLVCGSDWPFYHQAVALSKLLIATEGALELRRRVLFGNAARLLGL